MTECLRPIPGNKFPVLAGIHPAELRRRRATLSLARRAMEPRHLLHSALTCPPGAYAQPLKSRRSFVPAAQQLFGSSDKNNRSAALWVDHQWKTKWLDNLTRLRTFIPDTSTHSRDDPPKNTVGPAKPPPHQCRTLHFLLEQMGYGLLCSL